MIDLKEEQSKEYLNKVTAMAERAGCQVNIASNISAYDSVKPWSNTSFAISCNFVVNATPYNIV